MKSTLLPVSALLLLPVLGSAADPMTPTPLPPRSASAPEKTTTSETKPSGGGRLNQEVAALNAAFEETRDCLQLENSLKADLARKKASLAAEFKGKVPLAFDDLLWRKTQRINKQHAACFQQYDDLGRMFTAIHQSFRAIEPKNQNVKRQKDAVDALNAQYLQMMPTAKPYNKPPKPKPATTE